MNFKNPDQTYYLYGRTFETQEEAEEEASRLNPDPLYIWYVYPGVFSYRVIGKSKGVYD